MFKDWQSAVRVAVPNPADPVKYFFLCHKVEMVFVTNSRVPLTE